MGSTDYPLPPANSPNLVLVSPTPTEQIECLKVNGSEWKGPLNLDQYIERESYLRSQELTSNGAHRYWILVDCTLHPDNRPILSSCESYGKRAFIAKDGKVEDVIAHGIGSVFCRPEYRGRGYAGRMVSELGKMLDVWQKEKVSTKDIAFSVLYSDIGKAFYAKHGWKAFPSSHLSLAPVSQKDSVEQANGSRSLLASDMQAQDVKKSMCSDSVIDKYRDILKRDSTASSGAKLAISPDFEHMSWHWAREDFYTQKLFPARGKPLVKGACVEDRKVFIAWNRNFGSSEAENTLYILRCLYDEPQSPSEEEAVIEALAAVLRRAQNEASEWNMKHVEIWNPTPLLHKAARVLAPDTELVHREKNSICSLKLNGKGNEIGDKVDWYWNEKYSWC